MPENVKQSFIRLKQTSTSAAIRLTKRCFTGFFFSLLTYCTIAKILKTMKKIHFNLSRYTVYHSEEKCALIGLYGDSAHKFSFSTFLTTYIYKIRKRPQTIHVSKLKFHYSLLKKKKNKKKNLFNQNI